MVTVVHGRYCQKPKTCDNSGQGSNIMGSSPNILFAKLFASKARTDARYAVAYALLQVADAQRQTAHAQAEVASSLRMLGLGDPATPMGAMEFLSIELRNLGEALKHIAGLV
jgi:hypothetical protein